MAHISPEEFLTRADVPYQVFYHTSKPVSTEAAAKERNQQPSQVIKTLIFRINQTSFFAVLCPGDRQISWKKLRQIFSSSRLTTATNEEVYRITGCQPGTVSPLCLPDGLPVLVDSSVNSNEIISVGSCVSGKAIILRSSDLLACLNFPTTHDLADLRIND